MFSYSYIVSYILRPNKNTNGSKCAFPMTFSKSIDDNKEQLKALKVLSMLHRVNPTAIEDMAFTFIRRELKIVAWLKSKVAAMKARFA